jgi:hypothetical protein
MTRHFSRGSALCALLASTMLLGVAPQGSGSMYLRAPNLPVAPIVERLSYDAVATVPARANTPAALLPVDRVEGAMVLAADETSPAVDRSSFNSISTFTVVQVNDRGVVVQRTVFRGVSVESVDMVGTGDGSMVRRVRFDADKVIVTTPSSR